MSNPEQFFNKIYAVNKWVSTNVTTSLKKERVRSCQDFLKYNPRHHSFFWLKNNFDYSLHHISNIKYNMGHDMINAKQSIALIHPEQIDIFCRLYLALSRFCVSGELGKSLLYFSFVIHLPMRDIHNNYWLVRQSNQACELNAKNQALSFLSWHDILSPYHGEPISIKAYFEKGIRAFEIEERIKKQADYYKALPFTIRQQEILKMYIRLDKPKASDVAKTIGVARETIYTHNRDMLYRARTKYQRNFRDIYQLADFFERQEVFYINH